jgi:S1-C subfamily serine protease
MNNGTVFVIREGSKLGPFTIEEATLLIQSGELKSSEILIIAGISQTAHHFLTSLVDPCGSGKPSVSMEEIDTPSQISASQLASTAEFPQQKIPHTSSKELVNALGEQERQKSNVFKSFPQPSQQSSLLRGSIILGYLCSGLALLLFPPVTGMVAFFSGVYVLLRGRVSHGVAIILVSLSATFVGLAIAKLFAGQENKSLAMDLPAIHAATMPAVVKVTALNSKGDVIKTGTGFLIEDGMIVTNYHVVEGATNVQITMCDGSDSECRKIVALDQMRDLAIFVPDTPPAKSLRIADNTGHSEGERVAVIGNPLGFDGTISDGIVSANRTDGNGVDIIQITAPISHGSSGSPVVNARGEVLGIATMIFSGGQNLNFAVSACEITKVLKAKKTGNSD